MIAPRAAAALALAAVLAVLALAPAPARAGSDLAHAAPATGLEPYRESLHVSQLPDGKVFALFSFDRTIRLGFPDGRHTTHYGLMPRSIGEVFQAFDVRELHLTFTQGRWDLDRWGHSPASAPSGVELWAWLNSTNVDAKWKGLTNALAGLFCASLNFIDQAVTTEPLLSFDPEGDISLQSGIADLLNAYRIFDGNFQSMGVHLTPKCATPDCSDTIFEFRQTFAVVLDNERINARRDWSFQTLFQRHIHTTCPFAASTTVHLHLNKLEHESVYILPTANAFSDTPTSIDRYFTVTQTPFFLDVHWEPENLNSRNPRLAPVKTHRYLSGVGQERGAIVVDFTNDLPTPMRATYFDSIPFILKMYLHTLRVVQRAGGNESTDASGIVRETFFQPAMDRLRPNVLELSLVLPPKSKTTISIDFDCTFLKYTEHHPDANHGFELGVGVLTLESNPFPPISDPESAAATPPDQPVRIYTESLLVRLPTPDFSMPYNVITLTCTLLALFFGSVFNMLTRGLRPVPIAGKSLLDRFRRSRKA
nr:hypothetical protein HK105_006489 [Polyrhizophydium stewartii]